MNYLSFDIFPCRINGYGKRNTSIRLGLYSKYAEDTRLILIAKAVESLCRAGLHAIGRLKTKKQFSDGLSACIRWLPAGRKTLVRTGCLRPVRHRRRGLRAARRRGFSGIGRWPVSVFGCLRRCRHRFQFRCLRAESGRRPVWRLWLRLWLCSGCPSRKSRPAI